MASQDSFKIRLVGFLGGLFLRTLNRTVRWQNRGHLADPEFWHHGGSRIVAFWHGQQLLMPFTKVDFDKKTPIYALISAHLDGRMIANAIDRVGISSVAGSSSKGGRQAAMELVKLLKEGCHAAITPDGPRGPPHETKPGAIFIASQSGRPIYPFAIAAERYWQFKSWDKMILPKPFTRAVRIVGERLDIPAGISSEQLAEYQKILTERLNAVTAEANSHVYT